MVAAPSGHLLLGPSLWSPYKIQPYPPPGSCVAKNSPASVETVQGGVPPYGVKETLVVNGGIK